MRRGSLAIGLFGMSVLSMLAWAYSAMAAPPSGQSEKLSGSIPSRRGLAPLVPDKMLLEASSPAAALTSDGGYVFVLRGDTLYKISESTLGVVKSARLSARQVKPKARYKSTGRRLRKPIKHLEEGE